MKLFYNSTLSRHWYQVNPNPDDRGGGQMPHLIFNSTTYFTCLLYTSDAADEEDSVDLGGRRIIKKTQFP